MERVRNEKEELKRSDKVLKEIQKASVTKVVQDAINNAQQSDSEEIGAESSSFVQEGDCYDNFAERDCFDLLDSLANEFPTTQPNNQRQ